MSARFAHLHVHSEYSLSDSTIRIKELVKRCAALDQPSVALTDRNNLFALVKFYKAAEGAGIKPVMGADISLAEGDEPASTLTLLCRDHDGYLSLSRLLTRAWMEGHRTDGVVVRPEWLREANTGLFAIAGRHGPAAKLLAGGRDDLARQWYAQWREVFDDRLFLQLTRCGFDDEAVHNALALQVSSDLSLPVIAGNDVRFLDAEGFDAHEARVCISTGRVLDDPRRPKLYTREQYLKSADEMAALFSDVPDAIDNTLALAQRCNLELRLG
ncbi:MAG: PHP domain-containing protein, partial [Dokdonella sp.]